MFRKTTSMLPIISPEISARKAAEIGLKNRVNTLSSVLAALRVIKHFALFIKKDFNMVTADDILKYAKSFRKANRKESYVANILIHIKCFYKWLLGNNETYPDNVKWIKAKIKCKKIKKEDLLTEEDIVKLLKACGGTDKKAVMKRAVVMCITDTGGRISEILGVVGKDIEQDEYGYILAVDGKTGYRRIRLFKAVPYLKEWLNIHNCKEDMPLFVNIFRYKNSPLSYDKVLSMLKELKEIAEINKPVNPHAFRHRRVTEMNMEGFTDKELNIHFGWKDNSNMARRYSHITDNDVGNKILKKEGVNVKELKKKEDLRIKVCPRCGEYTLPHNDYCNCGLLINDRRIKSTKKQIKDDIVKKILQLLVNDEELSKDFVPLLNKCIKKHKIK